MSGVGVRRLKGGAPNGNTGVDTSRRGNVVKSVAGTSRRYNVTKNETRGYESRGELGAFGTGGFQRPRKCAVERLSERLGEGKKTRFFPNKKKSDATSH